MFFFTCPVPTSGTEQSAESNAVAKSGLEFSVLEAVGPENLPLVGGERILGNLPVTLQVAFN